MIQYNAQVIRQETETGTVFIFLCQQNGEVIKVLQAVFLNDIEIINKGMPDERIEVFRTYPIFPSKTSGIIIEDHDSEYLYSFSITDKQGYKTTVEGLQLAEKSIQNKFIKLIDKVNDIK